MQGLMPLGLYLAGFFFVFVAERVIGTGGVLRWPLLAIADVMLLVALGLRVKLWMGSQGETRRVLGRLVPAYVVGLLGLGLYAAGMEGSPLGLEGDTAVLFQLGAWVLGLLGTVPLLLMEVSLVSMYGAQHLETRRMLDSGRAGVAIALALTTVGFANFAANESDERVDFRTVRDLEPSASTIEMVRNLSVPVVISVFFPPANDVGEQIDPYFTQLDEASEQLTVERLDRDMQPSRAKELRARKNGTIVISQGDTHESLVLDVDPDKARRKLKKLDKDFQTKLNKVARDQRLAYFTVGHGERSTSPKADDPPGLKLIKEVLKQFNYKVKKLGLDDGLGNAVPDDATIVVIAGPTYPLLPAEQESIVRYLEGGGAVVLLLDPEREAEAQGDFEPLLTALGLELSRDVLAHDSKFVTYKRGKTDRTFLATNRFTTHDSTRILGTKSSSQFVLVKDAGSLEKREGAPAKDAGGPDVQFTVRSMSGTWADLDGDLEFSKDSESKKVYQLVAAVQLAAPEGDGDKKGGRALVSADADIFSDFVLGSSQGNQQLFVDGLRWLEDDVQLSGEVAEIEDVRILHTQEEDRWWFYGSTLGVPLLVMGFGLVGGWRRRQRSQS